MVRQTLSKKIEAGLPRPAVSKYAAKHPQQIVPADVTLDEPQTAFAKAVDLAWDATEYHFAVIKGGTLLRCWLCGKTYLRYDPKTVATIEVRMRDHYNVKHGGAQAEKAVRHD